MIKFSTHNIAKKLKAMHWTISQFAVAKHDSFDSTTAWRSKETDKERG